MNISDCGLRIADLNPKSKIRNPKSENPKSTIRNPQSYNLLIFYILTVLL